MPRTRRTASQPDRLTRILAALEQERAAFNAKLSAGHVAVLQTAFGPYRVYSVTAQHEYSCAPANTPRDTWNSRTFSGSNDAQWERLLREAGVARVAY